MKNVSEVHACVLDYGSFACVAEALGKVFEKVWYYSPFEAEFLNLQQCCIGDGLFHCQRVDELMDPAVFNTIDLWIFPDRGFYGLQKYLRSIGKPVWGSFDACEFEEYRTTFLKLLKGMGLPMVKSKVIHGLTNLADYLKTVKRKWVKIDRYRANGETWFHLDYDHSLPELRREYQEFGGLCEHINFVVQDEIPTDIEIGYDGYTVRGIYPARSFQGYEKKNQLYLGSLLDAEDTPDPVKEINEALVPFFEEYQYQNWFATEIRVLDDVPYFIDPTLRLPGQTGEHQMKSCSNLADIIWFGAHGQMIDPEFEEGQEFAAEATLHYKNHSGGWKVLDLSEEAREVTMLYHYCHVDGLFHFPPRDSDEVGVVVGHGSTVEECQDNLKENLELLKDEPVSADLGGFVDLIKAIKVAAKEGIQFTDQALPKPTAILED